MTPSLPNRTVAPATFDAAPARTQLLATAAAHDLSLTELAALLRLPRRTLTRVLRSPTLRWYTADRIAVALGRHPSELWPTWWTPAASPRRGPTAERSAG